MSVDLTFSIMTDSSLNEVQFIEEFSRSLGRVDRVGGYIKYAGNIIKVEKNSLYDESRAKAQSNKSWMYYRYNLSVFPEKDIAVDVQRKVASELLRALRIVGMAAELVAEFEI